MKNETESMGYSAENSQTNWTEKEFHPLVSLQDSASLPVVGNAALHRYLKEISHYRLLSREETDELAHRFKETGDPDLAYQLVTANLRLVVKVAMDFQKYWMQNFLDLVQEGNIGLVQAVKKFDPYRQVKFSYYAVYWIKAYILKFIMDNWRLVKIGTTQAQRRLFFSLNKERKLLESQGLKAETKLLAQRLGVKEREVIEMSQRLDNWDISLEAPLGEDSGDERKDLLPSAGPNLEEGVASEEIQEWMAGMLSKLKRNLNDKERVILHERLLSDEPVTLQHIADRFAISRERVRQIEASLLKKLRTYLENEAPDIKEFFENSFNPWK